MEIRAGVDQMKAQSHGGEVAISKPIQRRGYHNWQQYILVNFESETKLPSLPWWGVCELGFQAGLIRISSELGSGVDGPAMAGVCTRRAVRYAGEGCGSGKGRPVNKKLAKVPGTGAGSSG